MSKSTLQLHVVTRCTVGEQYYLFLAQLQVTANPKSFLLFLEGDFEVGIKTKYKWVREHDMIPSRDYICTCMYSRIEFRWG